MAKSAQTAFSFSTWGGRRAGSGRKRAPHRIGLLPHVGRPAVDRHTPALVTLRATVGVPNFRSQRAAAIVLTEVRRASRPGFRLIHFSIQTNHLHLLVEADDAQALSRGMQRLASRIALGVNLLVSRRGSVWRDRYHRRDLRSPRQYRSALAYVLFNFRKHSEGAERQRRYRILDGLSSAIWLDAWSAPADLIARIRNARAGPAPVSAPESWLARRGWLRHGAMRPDESPRRA